MTTEQVVVVQENEICHQCTCDNVIDADSEVVVQDNKIFCQCTCDNVTDADSDVVVQENEMRSKMDTEECIRDKMLVDEIVRKTIEEDEKFVACFLLWLILLVQ